MGVVKMLKKLIHKKKDGDVDDLKNGLKTFVDSPAPSSVTASSSAESGIQLSPHVLNEIDTELDNFEIIKPQRLSRSNIQSSTDATEVVFEKPRDPAFKFLFKVKKLLGSSFEEHSTTTGKPGQGRNVKIMFDTKDRPSLPNAAGKPTNNFTRTTSEACSIEAARVEKASKDMQQSEMEENYSPKSTRKGRFADDGSSYGIVKTAKIAPSRYGVPTRWAADDESSTWAPRRYSQVASSVRSAGPNGYTAGTIHLTGASTYSNRTSTLDDYDDRSYSTSDTSTADTSDNLEIQCARRFLDFVNPLDVTDDRTYITADTSNDLEIQCDNNVQILINRLAVFGNFPDTHWLE